MLLWVTVGVTVFVAILTNFIFRLLDFEPPEKLKKFSSASITFSTFVYGYSLLEILLCAMIAIKDEETSSTAGWITLIVFCAPVGFTAFLLWNF